MKVSVILEAGSLLAFVVNNASAYGRYSIRITGNLNQDPAYDLLRSITAQDLALGIEYIPSRPNLPNPPFPFQYPTNASTYPGSGPSSPTISSPRRFCLPAYPTVIDTTSSNPFSSV